MTITLLINHSKERKGKEEESEICRFDKRDIEVIFII